MSSLNLEERTFSHPLVFVLSPEFSTKLCSYCLKPAPHGKQLSKCGRCFLFYYCGKQCQTQAWTDHHKFECRFLRNRSSLPQMELLFFTRIIGKMKKNKLKSEYNEAELPPVVKRRTWGSLMSHKTEILAETSTHKISYFDNVKKQLMSFMGLEMNLPDIELFEIFGKKITNSYGISDNKGSTIGEAMDLYVSAYDHSCRPNVGVVYDGFTVTFRALEEDLNVYDTSQAFISYVELLASKATRRKELERKYFFKCQCERCLDPIDDWLTAIRCANPNCKEPVVVDEDYIPQGSHYATCKLCYATIMAVPVLEGQLAMRKISEFTNEDVRRLCSRDALKACLEKIKEYETILHPLNVYFADICTTMLQYALGLRQELETALHYAKIVTPAVRICYPPKYKSLGFHLLKMAYIHILLRQYVDAIPYVDECVDIFDVCFGPRHRFSVCVRTLVIQLLREDVETSFDPDYLLKLLKF